MSKLAIILCAALFASAANASFISTQLEKAHENLNSLLDITITQVKTKIADAKQVSEEIGARIEKQILDYQERVANDVESKLQKAVDEVNDLIREVKGVDVTECIKFVSNLRSTAEAALLEVKKCFADKVATAAGYVENMIEISNNVLASLNQHKKEAQECIENVDSTVSALEALLCINGVKFKAVLTIAKAVPSVSFEIAKLTHLLNTLEPTLKHCTTVNALDIFFHDASIILDSAKNCIHEKTNKAREIAPATTSVPEK